MQVVSRPVASRRLSRAKQRRQLWVDFCHSFAGTGKSNNQPFAHRKLPKSMNVSTVYPEDYPVHQEEPTTQRSDNNAAAELERGANHHPQHQPPSQSQQSNRRSSRTKDYVGLEEVTRVGFLIPLFAEALGTCLLVIIGCASCINWADTQFDSSNVLHIALTFGLAVASLAHVLGPVSGCHVNPAVTVGLLISGNCTILKALCYVVCQCCGAVAGSAILKAALPIKATQQRLGMTVLGAEVGNGQGVLIEAIVTFLLVLVVHGVTDPKREDNRGWAPLAIGLSISVAHLAAIPLTGSSMNPARSLGPAAIIGLWTNHWIYWVGPLVGAVIAGALYRISLRARSKDEEQGSYDF